MMFNFEKSVVVTKLIGISILMTTFSACRTSSPVNGTTVKNFSDREDIPSLKFADVDSDMLQRIIAWARPDAEAIFGGTANIQQVIFDDVVSSGPCKSVLGARIIFQNGDTTGAKTRPYVMVVLDPVYNGGDKCVYASQSALKSISELRSYLAGSSNFEALLGSAPIIKLSLSQAIDKAEKGFPTFGSASELSILNSDIPGMANQPWGLILGTACGADAVIYVNLNTGAVLQGPRPIKSKC